MNDKKLNLLDPSELENISNLANNPKEFAMMRLTMSLDKSIKSNYVVDSEEKAIYLINDYLKDSPNEMLVGIALDVAKHPICCSVIAIGDDHSIPKNLKNVFKFCFASCGDSFILVHNHPHSNNLNLSNDDLNVINDINNVATKLNIKIRDFIVVGNANHNRAYYSHLNKQIITQYDFIKNLKNNDNIQKPIDSIDDAEMSVDEINDLLAESKYNSLDDNVLSKGKSKGFFGMFK